MVGAPRQPVPSSASPRHTSVGPRQRREQARAALRERKFADAYQDWLRELRDRAWIERREAPL